MIPLSIVCYTCLYSLSCLFLLSNKFISRLSVYCCICYHYITIFVLYSQCTVLAGIIIDFSILFRLVRLFDLFCLFASSIQIYCSLLFWHHFQVTRVPILLLFFFSLYRVTVYCNNIFLISFVPRKWSPKIFGLCYCCMKWNQENIVCNVFCCCTFNGT